MTIGLSLTKQQLDTDFGQAALALRNALRRIEELHHFCLITPDSTFKTLGYSDGTGTNPVNEIAIIKSAFTDGDTLNGLAVGTGTLAAAQNLLANLDQLAGDLLT